MKKRNRRSKHRQLKRRNAEAKALQLPVHRQRVVPNKKRQRKPEFLEVATRLAAYYVGLELKAIATGIGPGRSNGPFRATSWRRGDRILTAAYGLTPC